jgi:hypothetical protein
MTLIPLHIANIELVNQAATCPTVLSHSREVEVPSRLYCYHDVLTISQAARDKRLQIVAAVL